MNAVGEWPYSLEARLLLVPLVVSIACTPVNICAEVLSFKVSLLTPLEKWTELAVAKAGNGAQSPLTFCLTTS